MANTLHLTGNASELDKLIQSFEFENQQHVKLIEAENQQISALEKELLSKKEAISRLQEQISSFDEETKRAHKQFTINRENVENLKKTAIVLKEHEEALEKKKDALIELGERESKERSQIMEHYQNIWRDYEAKYKTFPLAKTLQTLQKENRHLEEQLKEKEKDCGKLREQLASLSDPTCNELKNFKSFAIIIAGLKLETYSVLKKSKVIASELLKSQEELQKAQMNPKRPEQTDLTETTEQQNQQQDTSHTSHHINTGPCDDSMLISVFRGREEDESNVQMQETNSSQPVLENLSCHSVSSTTPHNHSNQEESMICSSSGEHGKEKEQGLSVVEKPKQVINVNEQGDNEKTALNRPMQQQFLVQSALPVQSKLNKRVPPKSPMMPKSYLPSLEEMRVKVAVPVQKPTQKFFTENSLKSQEILMPSISQLSIKQKGKVAPKGPASSVFSSQITESSRTNNTRVSTASFSNQQGKNATATRPRAEKEMTTPMYEESTQGSPNSDRSQMVDLEKEQQNPFTPTNEILCPKTSLKANQSSQDIEMQEMEPSKTGFMPKTPKAKSNTREISSANSTPDSLQGSVVSSGGTSPFDLAKHSERIQMFHKSPGLPPGLYTSKVLFTSSPETNTTSNSTLASLGTHSKMTMQEANAFGTSDFIMQGAEPNPISGSQGFREFNLGEAGFSFNNSADSTGSAGFNFGEATDKSTEMPGFSFGNSFQFGGNSSTGDKCDNFLSVFDTGKDGGQMESQETGFSFSFGGFQ